MVLLSNPTMTGPCRGGMGRMHLVRMTLGSAGGSRPVRAWGRVHRHRLAARGRDRGLDTMPAVEVASLLEVDVAGGLTAEIVAARHGRYGPNEVDPMARPSLAAIVWRRSPNRS